MIERGAGRGSNEVSQSSGSGAGLAGSRGAGTRSGTGSPGRPPAWWGCLLTNPVKFRSYQPGLLQDLAGEAIPPLISSASWPTLATPRLVLALSGVRRSG